jgi:hypothetical protein
MYHSLIFLYQLEEIQAEEEPEKRRKGKQPKRERMRTVTPLRYLIDEKGSIFIDDD